MIAKSENIVIYGTSQFAQNVAKQIIEKQYYKVIGFMDNIVRQAVLFNRPVLSVEQAKMNYGINVKIIIIEEMPYTDEKYLTLYRNGYKKIYTFVKECKWFEKDGKFTGDALQKFDLKKKPVLRYVEAHVSDICNLNCKGCTHFSNIFQNNQFDLKKFEKTFKRLSELFDISMIRLMGGEPLMSPWLIECIKIVRKYNPKTNIFIVTNGLLIPNLRDDVCVAIRENRIKLTISVYKPTYKIIDLIEQFLAKHNIIHFYGNNESYYSHEMIISTFHTCLSHSSIRSSSVTRVNCYNEYCWFLYDNKLYKCGYPPLSYKLNEVFGTDYRCSDNDGFDIFKEKNGWAIIEGLAKNVPFCQYCSSSKRTFLWERNRKNALLNDYIV